MAWKPYQTFTITAAGTPQRVSTTNKTCNALLIEALWTNTGRIYIGDSTLNVSTKTGLLNILPAPSDNTKGPFPAVSAGIPSAPNGMNLADIWIDSQNSSEGVIISFLEN